MKKTKLFMLSAATLLFATSCSEDKYFESTEGDGTVLFTVSLPGEGSMSRAFGDGLSAKNLKYAVYDNNGNYVMQSTADFGNSLSTNVSLTLANGQSYKIVFFAYNNSTIYSFNAEDKTVEVKYSQMNTTSNFRNDHDCFYKMEEITVTGPMQQDVILNRPVAQINWGTNDLTSQAVTNAYNGNLRTKFIGKAYSKLNLLTGEASDEVEIIQNTTTKPIESQYGSFPVTGYDYLNMIYLLVPKDESSLVDCKLETYKGSRELIHTINVPNVPVERNYRTNIYGSLLTSNVNITVEKDVNWTDSYNKEVWKGEVKEPVADAEGNYAITSSAELAGLAKLVNNGNTLEGKTVTLKADLDLNNIAWTPIGLGDGNSVERVFNGSFDGEGHTIKNLSISLQGKNAMFAGLFGRAWSDATMSNVIIDGVNIDATGAVNEGSHAVAAFLGGGKVSEISNVIVKNVKIKGYHYAGGISGNIYANIKNCEVSGIEIAIEPRLMTAGEKVGKYDFGDKAGAIAGYYGEGTYTVSGNKASNVKITGFRDLGGMFGAINKDVTYSNNTISNGEIIVSLTNTDQLYDNDTWGNIGEVVGRPMSGSVDGGSNTHTNVAIYTPTVSVSNLQDLATAVAKGGYIGIADNASIDVTASVTIDKPTVISLPVGASINMGANTINNTSDMTIKGCGTVVGSSFVLNNNGGTMVIEDGVFKTTATDINHQPVRNDAGSLTINGGYFEAPAGAAVLTNFVDGNTGELIINGGTFVNNNSGQYVLHMYGNGNHTINGGTFVGYFGCARVEGGAQVEINGGDFICNGSGNTYHALAVNPNSDSPTPSSVTVNGGNFWSTTSTLYCKENSSLTLNGGQYKAINSSMAQIGSGFKAVDIDDEKTVTVGGQNIVCKFTKAVIAE
ncbi:MAG: hypothetical protein NC127_00025 [Muribaculum sp.]|nr:hypothetical protein [Muribaculum sp.]